MTIKDLKEACDASMDVARVVAQFVELRPNGREHKALCPFHDDHKPSMCVVPRKGMYHCFSCGAGGDAYRFVMDYMGVDFPDAVRRVAEILGIQTDGKAVRQGERAVREAKVVEQQLMTVREIVDEYRWYKEHAYEPAEWADGLGIDPAAMELAGIVAAPYRHNLAKRVLVARMRDHEGTICSLRFRDFETKKRWSLDKKERIAGALEQTAGTNSGVMTIDDTFDPDPYLEDTIDLIVEGETDLLGAMTILIRTYGGVPGDWPARVIAIPGVMSCHETLMKMRLSPTVTTFFDLDGAGFKAAFDHRPLRKVRGEDGRDVVGGDGRPVFEVDREAPRRRKLLGSLQDRGVVARACFPPKVEGRKYDLRDMARDGWDWHRLFEWMLAHSTADPLGRRVRRLV